MTIGSGDTYDAIVVGAGLGGLSAAAALAKTGQSVALIERQSGPGGNARAFLRDLHAHAPQRQFFYTRKWRLYDLIIWDNRQTMHRARAFRDTKEPRDMRRTTIMGDGPTAQQAAA